MLPYLYLGKGMIMVHWLRLILITIFLYQLTHSNFGFADIESAVTSRHQKNPLIESLKIIGLTTAGSIAYGITHDLITTQISFDYFAADVTHHGPTTREYFPAVYRSNSRIAYAFLWGTIATWWVGAGTGILLAGAAQLGSKKPTYWRELIEPVGYTLAANLAVSLSFGLATYLTTSDGRRSYYKTSESVFSNQSEPASTDQRTFETVAVMHESSYLAGAVLGGYLIYRTYMGREEVSELLPEVTLTPQRLENQIAISPSLHWHWQF